MFSTKQNPVVFSSKHRKQISRPRFQPHCFLSNLTGNVSIKSKWLLLQQYKTNNYPNLNQLCNALNETQPTRPPTKPTSNVSYHPQLTLCSLPNVVEHTLFLVGNTYLILGLVAVSPLLLLLVLLLFLHHLLALLIKSPTVYSVVSHFREVGWL